VPVVIGESLPQTRPVFVSTAEANNSPIVFAEEYETALDIDFELKGNYQEKNKQTILCAIKTLTAHTALRITDEHIARGMARVCENTGLMGRWQTISERPKAVCDTGHNLAGWQYLAPQIRSQKCKTLRIVFGMVDDKDIDSVMDLLPTDAVYYWTQADNHRAISSETVKQKGDMRQLRGQAFASVALAYDKAVADAATDDFIFVGGSSYVVADLLCHIARQA
jgi:dihydrofolate synthase/folylpolyglutamate synthase